MPCATSLVTSWVCGDAKCILCKQYTTRQPSNATYGAGCLIITTIPAAGHQRGEDVAAVRKGLRLQSLRLQEDASCTPLHASRGRRDVSGLVQLAAYHHGSGIRGACTNEASRPARLTAAGSTAHLHPNADGIFKQSDPLWLGHAFDSPISLHDRPCRSTSNPRQPLNHTWRRGETLKPGSTSTATYQGLQVNKPTHILCMELGGLGIWRNRVDSHEAGLSSLHFFLCRITTTAHVLYTHVINKLEAGT